MSEKIKLFCGPHNIMEVSELHNLYKNIPMGLTAFRMQYYSAKQVPITHVCEHVATPHGFRGLLDLVTFSVSSSVESVKPDVFHGNI